MKSLIDENYKIIKSKAKPTGNSKCDQCGITRYRKRNKASVGYI